MSFLSAVNRLVRTRCSLAEGNTTHSTLTQELASRDSVALAEELGPRNDSLQLGPQQL